MDGLTAVVQLFIQHTTGWDVPQPQYPQRARANCSPYILCTAMDVRTHTYIRTQPLDIHTQQYTTASHDTIATERGRIVPTSIHLIVPPPPPNVAITVTHEEPYPHHCHLLPSVSVSPTHPSLSHPPRCRSLLRLHSLVRSPRLLRLVPRSLPLRSLLVVCVVSWLCPSRWTI